MAIPLSYNLRNAVVRWRTNLLAVVAIGLVVAVVIALIALQDGFRSALRATGQADNGIMVQKGASSELQSSIAREVALRLTTDDRVARDRDHRPLASPELLVIANLQRNRDGARSNVSVRGVTDQAFEVRRALTLSEGRRFTPGLQELIIGKKLVGRYRGMQPGASLRLQARDWLVVGVFAADGSAFENEVWGDLNVLAPAFGRAGAYQSLTLRLLDARQLEPWAGELESDPQLRVQLEQERAFYERQSGNSGRLVLGLAYFVAIVMGIGAVFAATNTMYATVASRGREIATLRALGFSRGAIVLSFLLESVAVAVTGGLLGCLAAQAVNLLEYSSQGANFSQITYAFRVTPGALWLGMSFSLAMGLLGGVLPAIRAARTPVALALRGA